MGDLESELAAFEAELDGLDDLAPAEEEAFEEPPAPNGMDYSSHTDYDPANPESAMYADDPPVKIQPSKVQVVYGASAKIDIPEPPLKKAKTMPPGFDRKKKKKAGVKKDRTPTVALPAHLAEKRNISSDEVIEIIKPVVSKPPLPPTEPIIITNVEIVPDDDPSAIPATSEVGKKALEANAKRIYLRKAAGKIWNDMSLQEWPDNDFRIFCGDLGNEVNDSTLAKVFVKYASFAKAKVIRNKRTQKTKGYGFVSFLDPFDATTALKEMNGCYVGNRPIKLRKSKWSTRNYTAKGKKL